MAVMCVLPENQNVKAVEFKLTVSTLPENNFRFQVSGFRFQVSDFKFQVSNFRFQVSDFRFQVSSFKFQISNSSYLSTSTGLVLDTLNA